MGEGLTGSGLEHLHAVAKAHVGDALVPGIVALVALGDQVHVEALGTLAVGGAPVVRDSIFRILGPDFFTGRSWGFGQSVLDGGAYGWNGGLGTSWLVDPNHDLLVTVLTQRMFDTSEPAQVHRDIQTAAYAALG